VKSKQIKTHAPCQHCMKNNLAYILAAITFMSLITSIIAIVAYKLKEEQVLCESETDALKASISALETRLAEQSGNISRMRSDYEVMQSKNEELGESYSSLREDAYATLDKIEFFEDEIEESLIWFRQNSRIENITNARRIKNSILGRCQEQVNGGCTIKLGCFYLVNSEFLGIRYMPDKQTSGDIDTLQSLADIIRNYGGDCEDYSLFFKAEYNHAYESCKDEPKIEAWLPRPGSRYFLDLQETWYLDDAIGVTLPGGYVHPSIVCYLQSRSQGHCIVAFTGSPIESITSLDNLEGAPLVEPQDGRFMGFVDEGIMLSDMFIVITNDDLYLKSEYYGWVSYASMKDNLVSDKLLLIDTLS
jgi:hypothetical protein